MQETRYMRVKSMMTLAVAGILLAGGLGLPGCKRHERVATVTEVPEREGPSTQEAIKENLEKSLAELYNLPELGPGVAFKTPDDEQWNRYTSGILTHDLKSSNGPIPKLGQTVTVVYTGTFPG